MRALTLLAVLIWAGCSTPVTEALLTVSASGLQVGVDINRLHLVTTDTTSGFSGFDQTLLLCPEGGMMPPGCRSLPLSVVLYPGPKSPQDVVRVVVEGLRQQTVVLSSVAVFSFTRGVRQRLDFVLYGTCLNRLDCAGSDSVCDANGMCTHIMPTMMGTVDLAADDLSLSDDLASTTSKGDLGDADGGNCGDPGQDCCFNATCNGLHVACYNNTCQTCGTKDAWCCPDGDNLCADPLGCDDTFHCVNCGAAGEPCCKGKTCGGASACIQGICQAQGCGNGTQPCCGGGVCVTGLLCSGGMCSSTACSSPGSPCCGGSSCTSGMTCYLGTCALCGEYQEQACFGPPDCSVPFQSDPFAGICQLCDIGGYPCCGGKGGVCSGGVICDPTTGFCN